MKNFFKRLQREPKLSFVIRQVARATAAMIKRKRPSGASAELRDFDTSNLTRKAFFNSFIEKNETLYAIYDLTVNYTTFDVIVFILRADYNRRKRGLKNFIFIVAPGPDEGFRFIPDQAQRKNSRFEDEWRLDNILAASARLHPKCTGVSILSNRRELAALFFAAESRNNIFPPDYDFRRPRTSDLQGSPATLFDAARTEKAVIQTLATRSSARRLVARDLARLAPAARVVTLTLRQSNNQHGRNSVPGEWARLARTLTQEGYYVIVLKDVEAGVMPAEFEQGDFHEYDGALANLELRSALYELADQNLFVNGGSAAISYWNRFVNCLVFKLFVPSSRVTTMTFLNNFGYFDGEQLPHMGKHQKLVWRNDDYDILLEEFRQMEQHLRRDLSKFFDEPYYREQMAAIEMDVSDLSGARLFGHFEENVAKTAASPNREFDERGARAANPEIARAIADGVVRSAFHHLARRGEVGAAPAATAQPG